MPLSYQSNLTASLAPDERVLWDAHPQLPPKRRGWLTIIGLALIVPVITACAAISASGDVLWTTFGALGGITIATFGVIYIARKKAAERADAGFTTYRVTDRRILRSDDRPGKPHTQAEWKDLGDITVMHGPAAKIIIESVRFDRIEDPNSVERLVLEQWAKSNRRRKIRRNPMSNGPTFEQPVATVAMALPAEVVLAADERVLWIGRPRVGDPIDRHWLWAKTRTLLWLLIPTGLLLSSLNLLSWVPRAHWMAGVISGIWLFFGLQALTIVPWRDRRRRAATTYVFTNIRAIIHRAQRTVEVTSYLLDMISSVALEKRPDGASDLNLGWPRFERLTDGERAQEIALAAVRAAGTPWGAIVPPEQREDWDEI